ncbi:signal recognition particle-docking protein FtsY [Levilactobacillus namurensis]|uniref:signal recognition particle-docking protein FtsY n=1 Tax=Levilactobacillus namurensis TaxID=380393 RepID=UPI001D4C671D|nr:signal recognition particle-docking protein FtsY [Levilactobacillus namurensis]HJE44774.1 signal recognition particle-docking protein FtsY [Levilactobacillus namurensis]
MGLFDIFRRRAKKSATPTSEASVTEQSLSSTDTSLSDSSVSASVSAKLASSVSASQGGQESAVEAPQALTTDSGVAAPTSAAPAESQTSLATSVTDETSVAEEATSTVTLTSEATPSVTSEVGSAQTLSDTGDTTKTSGSDAPQEAVATEASTTPEVVAAEGSEDTPAAPAEPTSEASDEQLYGKGLEKTRHTFGERLNALLANFRHVDEGFFEDLEETLIGADVGFDMAVKLSDELRDEVKLQNAKRSQDVQNVIVEKMVEIYDQAGEKEESTALNVASDGPTVILFVGVNGVGKTTTIGKMAHRYHQDGKKVLLAAADTFRAGATEQLDVWAKRSQVDIVKGKPQSDPAAVVFDAVKKAKAEDYDILFVDTAGRLQNKVNLMNELSKMKRIITREIPTPPHEVLLVLDATTGQNALTQAKLFKESTDVTGIVLTKLDGTARGGIVLAIRNELHVPVKFIGLGEQINDLRPFNPSEFVYGLFKGLIDPAALGQK